ncbi:MAG: DUF1003 domain-containing protein [Betaproteobacteria bacterium]|nr:DUF1003 domain-containing protein [Betaproteobacteria bacterium]
MEKKDLPKHVCGVCGREFPLKSLVRGELVRSEIVAAAQKRNPAWSVSDYICRSCLTNARADYVRGVLEDEKGELTSLEQEVVTSLREHDIISRHVEDEFEQNWTPGERLADRIATFGGSWTFLLLFGGFLASWIVLNSLVLYWRPVDPYPYILLNLVLSCLAAIQAPVIMMSQNRQEAKDRLRSQHDYQVNLKAELEIRHLHEKIDHLLSHQWERLVQIQEIQLEALAELGKKK